MQVLSPISHGVCSHCQRNLDFINIVVFIFIFFGNHGLVVGNRKYLCFSYDFVHFALTC